MIILLYINQTIFKTFKTFGEEINICKRLKKKNLHKNKKHQKSI